jgi:micrococcal nuclease
MLQHSKRFLLWRHRGLGAAGAVVAAALLLATVACAGSHGAPATPATRLRSTVATATSPARTAAPAATGQIGLPDIRPNPARLERADVVRVIDGDTIVVRLSGTEEHIRYYGINTTEHGQPCFQEATDRNRELIGQSVLLLPDARDRDRYGRLLRYVFDASGASVDARLVGEGYAHAWRQDGAYRSQLIALEDQVQAAKIGCLWATAAP